MINDQWLILQHWRGGLQVLLVKGFFYILEGELTLLLEGELPHILRLFADFAPTHVWHNAGIRYLLVTFFTFHFSPHTQAHSLGYTFHSSFFTLFTIVAVLRGESCGEVGGTLPSPWEHRGHRHEGWFPPWGNPWGRGQKSESVSSNPRACVLTAALRTRQKKYALSCSVIDGRDRSG